MIERVIELKDSNIYQGSLRGAVNGLWYAVAGCVSTLHAVCIASLSYTRKYDYEAFNAGTEHP